jgi:hypothetical protein
MLYDDDDAVVCTREKMREKCKKQKKKEDGKAMA